MPKAKVLDLVVCGLGCLHSASHVQFASLADSSVAHRNPHLLRLVLNEQAAVLQAAAERLEELGKAAGGDTKASSWNARASRLKQQAGEHRELEGEPLHRCPTWCLRSLF